MNFHRPVKIVTPVLAIGSKANVIIKHLPGIAAAITSTIASFQPSLRP